MKKINIKIKYLILIAIVVVFTIGHVMPTVVLLKANSLEDEYESKALECYKTYASMISFSNNQKAYYKLGKSILPTINTYDLFLWFKNFKNDITTPEMIEEATQYYKKVLKGSEKNEFYPLAYKELLHIYTSMNETEKAKELMDLGEKSKNDEVVYISNLYRAFYYYVDRDFDDATKIVDKYLDKGIEKNDLYYLKGHIYFGKGEFEKANKYYTMADKMRARNYGENFFGTTKNNFRSKWIDEYIEMSGNNKIKGSVTFDGKGIPFVQIYLREFSKSSQIPSELYFVALTDSNGQFEIPGVKDGKYEISIGLCKAYLFDKVYVDRDNTLVTVNGDTEYNFEFVTPFSVIEPKSEYILEEDQFKIKWEEVPGADHYSLHAVNFHDWEELQLVSIMYPIPTKKGEYELKGTEAEFDLDVINSKVMGIYYKDEFGAINPTAIMGTFYPESKVGIYVVAYNEHNRILNSTMPLRIFYEDTDVIIVKNRKLSEGEKLIDSLRYKEAVSYYEEVLKVDPENKLALGYLTKMNLLGVSNGSSDLNKAINYGRRYCSIIEDYSLCMEIMSRMDSEELVKNKEEIYPILESMPKEVQYEEYYYIIPRFYVACGEVEKSESYYKAMGGSHGNNLLMLAYLYQGEFQEAINELESSKFDMGEMDNEKLANIIEDMKSIDKDSDDWQCFMEYIHDTLCEPRLEYETFSKIYEVVENETILEMLKELGKEYSWVN